MKLESIFSLVFSFFAVKSLDAVLLPSLYRDNVTDAISKAGYAFKVHEIITSDGYILKIHRVLPIGVSTLPKSAKSGCPIKPVIFLVHGFSSSSIEFVFMGRGKSLAYELVESGYDVFLGNWRGGYFTETHTTLSPSQDKFWDFSLTEIATIDTAESIDYVRTQTNSNKIFIYGESLGATVIMILLSEKPKYNDKLIQIELIGPVMWVSNAEDNIFSNAFTGTLNFIAFLTTKLPYGKFINLMKLYYDANCKNQKIISPDCALINTIGGLICHWADNGELMDPAFIGLADFVSPNISSKMIKHILQINSTKKFRKYLSWLFDKSIFYKLSNVKAPIRIQRGGKDPLMSQSVSSSFCCMISMLHFDIFQLDRIMMHL